MFKLTCENERGDIINLMDNTKYSITNISGLNPPKSSITTASVSSLDGARYRSSHLEMRNIVIDLYIQSPAEENRLELYKMFRAGKFIKFCFKNGTRDVFIEGYTEMLDVSYFERQQKAQISILCPQPYFMDAELLVNEFSNIKGLLTFPFWTYEGQPVEFGKYDDFKEAEILNNSDTECGLNITFKAVGGKVKNPILIDRNNVNNYIGVDFTLDNGDEVNITTERGNRKVTLIKGTQQVNLFNFITYNSSWLQAEIGKNVFVYDADSGLDNLVVILKHRNKYQGV